MRIRTVIAVVSLLLPLGAAAQIVPVGAEFQVNSYTLNYQANPAVAAGADGAFVVVWRSSNQDGSGDGVFGQRYDSAGQAVGTEFQVNSYTMSTQRNPSVAAGADGAFVVAWESYQDGSNDGVFAQRYDSAGQAQGTEFQVNSFTLSHQHFPAVAAGADGAFVVVWESLFQEGIFGVFGQRYDSAGQVQGTEFQVNSFTVGPQRFPAVAVGADGAFVVAWDGFGDDGYSYGVFGQHYNSAGQVVGAEFQVNSYTTSYPRTSAVAAGPDGAFVVAWASNGQDGSNYGVFGQRFAEPTATPTATPTSTPTDTPTRTATQTPTLTPTPSIAACPTAPSGTCATSLKAQLQLKLNASDTKDKLKWKFSGGPALAQGDFGDPTTSATYALCLYDDGALKAELQVGPSGTLWVPVGSKGYKYSDAAGSSDGITKINLLGGDADKSKLLLKGKGSALPMPTPVSGTRFFAQTSAVTAQLREVNGDCYATTFTDTETVKNTGTQYKAKK